MCACDLKRQNLGDILHFILAHTLSFSELTIFSKLVVKRRGWKSMLFVLKSIYFNIPYQYLLTCNAVAFEISVTFYSRLEIFSVLYIEKCVLFFIPLKSIYFKVPVHICV